MIKYCIPIPHITATALVVLHTVIRIVMANSLNDNIMIVVTFQCRGLEMKHLQHHVCN